MFRPAAINEGTLECNDEYLVGDGLGVSVSLVAMGSSRGIGSYDAQISHSAEPVSDEGVPQISSWTPFVAFSHGGIGTLAEVGPTCIPHWNPVYPSSQNAIFQPAAPTSNTETGESTNVAALSAVNVGRRR